MAATKPLFSYEDLAHTPDDGKRYEINDGELIVSPAPTFGHQRVGWKLSGLLMRAEEAGYGQGVAAPVDVVFGRHKTTQPDLLFIRRERLGIVAGGKVHGAPDLIVETLSPGSCDDDLGWKKTLYAREGVLDSPFVGALSRVDALRARGRPLLLGGGSAGADRAAIYPA